jgi:hypothetical protein
MGRRKELPMAQPLSLTIPDVAIQIGVCQGGGVLRLNLVKFEG